MNTLLLCLSTVLATPHLAGEHPSPSAAEPAGAPAGPFVWLELARSDLRGASPVTEQTLLVNPAAPLPSTGPLQGALLFTYRRDALAAENPVVQRLADRTLSYYELGFPLSYRLSASRALTLDARLGFGGVGREGLVPQITSGVSWQLSDDWTVNTEILWGRRVLNGIPVPLIGIYYRPQDSRLRFDALIPRYAEVAYRFNDTAEVFSTLHFEAVNWGTRVDGTDPRWLQRQELRVQAGIRQDLFGPIAVEASAQYTPIQQLAIQDGPGETELGGNDIAFTVALVLNKLRGS